MEGERDSFGILCTGYLLSIGKFKREIKREREIYRERERERKREEREREIERGKREKERIQYEKKCDLRYIV